MGSFVLDAGSEGPPSGTAPSKRYLNLLCLDGGGSRGLSSLYILQRILATKTPCCVDPLQCQYFDMIGGTSTGGLIAIMLGRLHMSINECIEAYVSLAGEVFRERKSRFMINRKGELKAKYDSEILKRVIQQVMRKRDMSGDELLAEVDGGEKTCRTGESDFSGTSYFDEIKIGPLPYSFLDGGFNANNPVDFLWNEAKMCFAPNECLDDSICCLISIGTGVDPSRDMGDKAWDFGKSLVKIATETEQTARFQSVHDDLYRDGRYFRFNVDSLGHIGLAEAEKRAQIYQETDYYLRKPAVILDVERCASALNGAFRFD